MQQVMEEQKVPKPDWYVQVDNSSEEVQVNRNSGLVQRLAGKNSTPQMGGGQMYKPMK